MVATEAKSPKLVIEKSTVPARTGEELKRALSVYGRKSNVKFRVASNPEFLREGTAVSDFLHPDRVVVGVEDEVAEKQMKEIYRPVLERKFDCPCMRTRAARMDRRRRGSSPPSTAPS